MDRGAQFPDDWDNGIYDRNLSTRELLAERGYGFTRSQLRDVYRAGVDRFHGTDRESAENIVTQGARTNFRGIQVHGPGFYVTAGDTSGYARGADPQEVGMLLKAENPIVLRHHEIRNIGAKFRAKAEKPLDQYSDADLGNIALRRKGHDYIHIIEGKDRRPTDFGVVLRPKAIKEYYGYDTPQEEDDD